MDRPWYLIGVAGVWVCKTRLYKAQLSFGKGRRTDRERRRPPVAGKCFKNPADFAAVDDKSKQSLHRNKTPPTTYAKADAGEGAKDRFDIETKD